MQEGGGMKEEGIPRAEDPRTKLNEGSKRGEDVKVKIGPISASSVRPHLAPSLSSAWSITDTSQNTDEYVGMTRRPTH